jgi:transcriptional regulator with XRE-family HTH domain
MGRVARRIANRRRALSLTQEGFAARLDIATKNVQRLESGHQNLTLQTVERIANVLDVTPEHLVTADVSASSARTRTSASTSILSQLTKAGFRTGPASVPGRRPAYAVPVMSIRAAAGSLRSEGRTTETLGWVVVPKAPGDSFVVTIHGESMSPRVPDGSACLFARAHGRLARGRLLLLQHESFRDTDLGGAFAFKRLGAVTRAHGRLRVALESLNRRYPTQVLLLDDPDDLQVIGEFVRVLV